MTISKEATRGLNTPHWFTESLGPTLRIAMLAGRRHLDATPPRIEGVGGPFDLRVLRQALLLNVSFILCRNYLHGGTLG